MTWDNLTWQLGTSGLGRALVIAEAGDPLAGAVARQFPDSLVVAPPDVERLVAEALSGLELVLVCGSRSFRIPSDARLRKLLSLSMAVVAPSGAVVVTAGNPWWGRVRGAWSAPQGATLGSLSRAFRRAGFGRVEEYYLHPWPAPPASVVPARAQMAAAVEALEHFTSGLARFRPAIARAGLHAFLYQGFACVGYR